MFLSIDIGNSNIVIGLHNGLDWLHTFRYETKDVQPVFYYESGLKNIFLEWGITSYDIRICGISSVVPHLNSLIKEAVFNAIGQQPIIINPSMIKNLDMHVPSPYEIGSDLVCNAYAAIQNHYSHCIIVDFGTALTFTVVDSSKGIQGVSIAPGLKTAIKSLFINTAQLPEVPLELPSSYIGHDTVSAIQSGVLYGYVGMVRGMVNGLKEEFGSHYKVIATGGLSAVLHPLEDVFDGIDKLLTLDGCRLICDPKV